MFSVREKGFGNHAGISLIKHLQKKFILLEPTGIQSFIVSTCCPNGFPAKEAGTDQRKFDRSSFGPEKGFLKMLIKDFLGFCPERREGFRNVFFDQMIIMADQIVPGTDKSQLRMSFQKRVLGCKPVRMRKVVSVMKNDESSPALLKTFVFCRSDTLGELM